MRSDTVLGGIGPDYPSPDHTGAVRTITDLQRNDPLILTSVRGNCCRKEHQQYVELAVFQSRTAVAYTQIPTTSTDNHHTLASRALTAFGAARGER
jgi:hypothetical protein